MLPHVLELIMTDIIYGGVREQVFGLKGEDMIFGSLDSQLYGQQGDDLIFVVCWS